MENLVSAPICRCNTCDVNLIDENPNSAAKEYNLDKFPDIMEMTMVKIDGWPTWVCPVCRNDENLMDGPSTEVRNK